MKKYLVVLNPEKWKLENTDVEVISSKDYLSNPFYASIRNARIFNLSRDYSYQSRGYYVSLLAEARGHYPNPGITNILDLRQDGVVSVLSYEIDDLIQKSLRKIKSGEYTLSIYFGKNMARQYEHLCQAFHRQFQVPLLRVRFKKYRKWEIESIRAIPEREIPDAHFPFVLDAASEYFSRKRYHKAKVISPRYALAILVKQGDSAPPSNAAALDKFMDAAETNGLDAEIIYPDEMNRIPTFDALFIRSNTHVNNETYRFARKAQAEGLALIDLPEMILKCSNKVFVTELLAKYKIPTPKTVIIQPHNRNLVQSAIGFPCVIKLPDSTFSLGVKKATNPTELSELFDYMFNKSDLLIAQEYCYSDFDWRIGLLDGKAIYACKYYMARDHWQIYNWQSKDHDEIEGEFECLPIDKVPSSVISIAEKSTAHIGNGLFGVDIKEINGHPVVIEVNDNPNIDSGIEDQVLGQQLYQMIIQSFRRRIESNMKSKSENL